VRKSQAVFYALSFFWLDGFAVPAPAQVSPSGTMAQTVGRRWAKRTLRKNSGGKMVVFNVGKWRLQITQNILAFSSLQGLIEDGDTLENHAAKLMNPLQWPSEFIEELKTYNSGKIIIANNVFARQMVVLLVTYFEAIINDFFVCLFVKYPERMYEYLTPKGEENALKGKVDLKEVIKASSKDDLLQSLADKATANATKGNFNSTIKILEQIASNKLDIKMLSALRSLVESRNRIVHEASTEVITAMQIRESAELIENFLRLLGGIAESNGIVVEDMFRKLDEIKSTIKKNV
jgi:hypothetical protein